MAAFDLSKPLEVLTLVLGGEVFAIEAGSVREILDLVPVTTVPNSLPFVNGLINVRGKVVPVADLRLQFGMEQEPPTQNTRIVVVEIELDGELVTIGLRADKVLEVTELAPASLEETPKLGMSWRPDFVRGIGKRSDEFIVIPDMERIFGSEVGAATHP